MWYYDMNEQSVNYRRTNVGRPAAYTQPYTSDGVVQAGKWRISSVNLAKKVALKGYFAISAYHI